MFKRRLLRVQNHLFNRPARFLLAHGLAPPTYALLETTGRRTGRIRQVPVANGLDGDTFWLIAGLGENAQYVRNIQANRLRALSSLGLGRMLTIRIDLDPAS